MNTDDIHNKFQQVTILIAASENIICNAYDLTVPPEFNEIDMKLYSAISKEHRCYPHGIDEKMLETCDSIPIIHRNVIPTLREVLDQIQYTNICHKVYLFIRPMKYTVGSHYISKLEYAIQVGIWIPKGEGWCTGKRFEPPIELNHHIFKEIELPHEELERRYNMVTPIKINSEYPYTDNSNVGSIDKPNLHNINNIAYVWKSFDEAQIVGQYQSTTKNIIAPNGQVYAKFLVEIPTFHRYAYHGFFKPSLDEVLMRMSTDMIDSGKQFCVTTAAPKVDINMMCIGDYHIGITMIWCVCDVADSHETPGVKNAVPTDDYNEEHCMICLDAKPNTMVMPCCHVVVCSNCSLELKKTGDAHICSKCRKPITEVIYP